MLRIYFLLYTRQTAVIIFASLALEAEIQMIEGLLPATIAKIFLVKIELRGRVAFDDACEVHWMSVGGRVGALRGEAGSAGEEVAAWTPLLPEVVGDSCDGEQGSIDVNSS